MNTNLLKPYLNKDGTLNYERASRSWGITKNDLYFYFNPDFKFIDPTFLISGVFVCYRPTSIHPMFYSSWKEMTCYHSKDDLSFMHGLITGRKDYPEWATYDYFIMNSSGQILYSNIDINQTIDENNIIHLTSPTHNLDLMTYVAERKKHGYKIHFCYGSSFDSLNKHIKYLIDEDYIKKPKHFKKGFSETEKRPIEQQPY